MQLPIPLPELVPRGRPTREIVFLHGLLGSRLVAQSRGNTTYWGDINAILLVLAGRGQLLAQTAPNLLTPTELTENYKAALKGLSTHIHHGKQHLRCYLYDWRLGLADASAGLDQLLDKLPSGVVLVGHSYGGLVAMYGVASKSIKSKNIRKLNRIVMIASPYYGTGFAMLGLARSADFIPQLRPLIPRTQRWQLDLILDRLYPLVVRRMLPMFSGFQSLYDMIPHDADGALPDCLNCLQVPGAKQPKSSEFWGYWGESTSHADMKRKARTVQSQLRQPINTPLVSICGTSVPTPHYCRVSAGPKYDLRNVDTEDGDGVVATCCAYPSWATAKLAIGPGDGEQWFLTHSGLLHHTRTHSYLDLLLS